MIEQGETELVDNINSLDINEVINAIYLVALEEELIDTDVWGVNTR